MRRGGPSPGQPPGTLNVPFPPEGQSLLPQVSELREEMEVVLGWGCLRGPPAAPAHSSHRGVHHRVLPAAAWPCCSPAPAACGHQGASDIRRRGSARVRAALSQDFSCCFPTSPSPCCWGRGQPPPLLRSGSGFGVPRARQCPLGLGLLSRARPSPSMWGLLASFPNLPLLEN